MTPHDCHAHVDNQGCCHTCGRPVNPDGWIAYHGGTAEDFEEALRLFEFMQAEGLGPEDMVNDFLPRADSAPPFNPLATGQLSSPWSHAAWHSLWRIQGSVAELLDLSLRTNKRLEPDKATAEDAAALERLAARLESALEAWRSRGQ